MKKYIAGFITDTHLSKNNLSANCSIFQQAIQICKSEGVELFHGGDFLEERGRLLEYDVKDHFETILDILSDTNFTLTGIVGNHDKVSYTSEKNWLSQFKYHPNLNLVESVGFRDIDKFRIHMISYFKEDVNFKHYLDRSKLNIDKARVNVLLTHIAINGVKNNDGSAVSNSLTKEDFIEFDLILSGHYHQQQTFGNFIYFGSALQKDFGEDNRKGITLLKSDGTLEFRKLEFKEFVKVQIDLDEIGSDELLSLKKKYKGSDSNIRFEFKGSDNVLKSLKKEDFTSLGIDVKTKSREVEDDIIFSESTEVVEHTGDSIIEEFKKCCEKENWNVEQGLKYLNKKLK